MSMQHFCRNLIQSHSQFSVKSQPDLIGKCNILQDDNFVLICMKKARMMVHNHLIMSQTLYH